MKLALILAALVARQDAPPGETVAIVGARIITVTRDEIASGTIVIRDGKIAEIGADVKAPENARVIDGRGLVAFPGLVHPYSRIAAARGAGGSGSNPHVLAHDDLSPSADIFTFLPRTGFTTVAIYPTGATVSGQAVAIKPVGVSREEMVVSKKAFLRLDMDATTAAKEQIKRDFEAGKRAFEAQKKPAGGPPQPQTPPQGQEKPPQPNPSEPSSPQDPPAEKPAGATSGQAPKTDDRMEPWIAHFKGDMFLVVELASPAELLHWRQVVKTYDDLKAPIAFVMPPDLYKATDRIAELKPLAIVQPELTFLPFTRTRVNVPAELAAAGATLAFVPSGDSIPALEGHLFKVAEIVKMGLPRDTALRAMTIEPARVLGLEKRIGSLEAGKDADIILLDGDPLSATVRVVRTLINGKVVWEP